MWPRSRIVTGVPTEPRSRGFADHSGQKDNVLAFIRSAGVMPMTGRDRWMGGPVWSCDCGAVLEATADIRKSDTTCDRCACRYHHQLIGQRTWKVTLLPRKE